MVAVGVDRLQVAGEVGRLGGVYRDVLRGVGVIRRVLVDGLRAGEERREVVAPALEVVVEVDFLEARARELGDSRLEAVVVEIGGRFHGAFDAVAILLEGEPVAVVDVTRRPLGVLNQVRAPDVPLVERLEEVLAVAFLELHRHRRETGIPRLVSGDRVGDPLGDEDGLAGFDGVEAVNRFLGGDVLAGYGRLEVLFTDPVGRVYGLGCP